MIDRAAACILIAALGVGCGGAPAATPVNVETATASPSPARTPAAPVAPEVAVPSAENGVTRDAPADAAKVVLDGDRLYVDGVVIGDVKDVRAAKGLLRIDALFNALKAKREKWTTEHPNDPFPGNVTFAFDADTPAYVVKSVFQTAAYAGFPYARFAVRSSDGPGYVSVDAQVPAVFPEPEPPTKPAPTIRQGTTTVTGKLPPEVVQRIVRQNFGRFRLCYENGLKNTPDLAGTVTMKFVIGVKGDVTSVTSTSSTLYDPTVIACLANAFKNLSFPQPERGTVTVVYPITFAPAPTGN